MNQLKFKLFVILLCCFVHSDFSLDLPKSVKICGRKNADFSSCVKEFLAFILASAKTGFPQYGIKSFEPMEIDSFSSAPNQPNAVFNVKQKYKNIRVSGFSGIQVKNVKATMNDKKCEIKLRNLQPHLEIFGDYEVDGKAMFFQVNGFGKVNITGSNVESTVLIICETYEKDNIEYFRLKSMKLDVKEMKNAYIYLENVFNGNKELSESINAVIQDNVNDVLNELGDGFYAALSDQYLTIANQYVKGIPTSELFLN